MTLRTCRRCRDRKPPDAYPPKTGSGPNAYSLYCNACITERENAKASLAALRSDGFQVCKTCNEKKPLSQFTKRVGRGDNAYFHRCIPCVNDASARHYRATEERALERAKAGLAALEGDGTTNKKCGDCQEVKSLNQFVMDRRSRDGLKRTCRDCDVAAGRKYRDENPEKVYVKANHLERRYGITKEIFEAMSAAQEHKCLICGISGSELKKGLHVDHDHETGAVRALICRGCNVTLGNANDDPSILRRCADYLEYYRAANPPPWDSSLEMWLDYLGKNKAPLG